MPNAGIESLNFLDGDECSTVASKVYGLKDFWDLREMPGSDGTVRQSYYTLGVPSYIDAVTHDKNTRYYDRARRLNPTLDAEFRFLYDRLAAALSNCLGGRVSYAAGLALPGFHIYPTEPGVQYPEFELHIDLQYKYIGWERPEEIDFRNPISFTVPVSLPDEGGGLNVCELSTPSFMLLSREELQPALKDKVRYIPYRLGEIILQRGLLLHGVAGWRNTISSSDRITLQGHALLRKDEWQIYW